MARLGGCRVIVTRPAAQAAELSGPLREAGAEVIEIPTIMIVDPPDGGEALRRLVEDLPGYAWVVVTSANGARRLCSAVARSGAAAVIPATVKVAAIGPATADEMRRHGVHVDLVPDRYVAESLVDAFPVPEEPGPDRVALVRAVVGRDVVPEGLRALGWRVDVVDAYMNTPAPISDAQAGLVGRADVVTFTSPSAVDSFMASVGPEHVPGIVACIGPVSAQAARRRGLTVDVEATEHTMTGLVEALIAHVTTRLS